METSSPFPSSPLISSVSSLQAFPHCQLEPTLPYTLFSHWHCDWLCNTYKMNLIPSPVFTWWAQNQITQWQSCKAAEIVMFSPGTVRNEEATPHPQELSLLGSPRPDCLYQESSNPSRISLWCLLYCYLNLHVDMSYLPKSLVISSWTGDLEVLG